MIYKDFRKLFPHRILPKKAHPRTISLIFFVLLFSSHLVGIPQIFTCSLLLRLSAESTPYHVTPGPIGKCAFWVKLWHKPPGFPESWRSWRLLHAGGKYKNQAKYQNQSWKPPETQRSSGHNANLWSEFNYVLIETQLLPNDDGEQREG